MIEGTFYNFIQLRFYIYDCTRLEILKLYLTNAEIKIHSKIPKLPYKNHNCFSKFLLK